MKQATVQKHVIVFAILTAFVVVGCKTGPTFKMENPFSRKPKAPSRETPKEIDGIQLSSPPEKYSKELTKKGTGKEKSSDKSLAQKGKYETFPASKDMKIDRQPEIAMNRDVTTATRTSSIPTYSSQSSPGSQLASSATGPESGKISTWPSMSSTPATNATPYPASSSPSPASNPLPQGYPAVQPSSNPLPQGYPAVQPSNNPIPQGYPTVTTTTSTSPTGSYSGAMINSGIASPASSSPAPTSAPGFAPGSIGGL